MKQRRQFDLVVFGAEPSGLAAAACAAKSGARCAVIKTGLEPTEVASAPHIPNFVWRQLDLQDTGLIVEPVSARVSLFEDGRSIATFPDHHRTREALLDKSPSDGALWIDFSDEMARKQRKNEKTPATICDRLADAERRPTLDSAETDPLTDILDDYFFDADLKTHLSTVAGIAFGLSGEEPGSGRALASLSMREAWPVKNGDILAMTMERVCERAGVERFSSAVRRMERVDARAIDIDFELGDDIRTRALMASSARLAVMAGLPLAGDTAALVNFENAEAYVSVKLADQPVRPDVDGAGDNTVFFIAESPDEIRAARDAVLEGRTPENPPLTFEFSEKEIIVRTPYCPKLLASEDGPREWTGQDRQVLGKQIVQRLGKYLNGALTNVQRTDVKIHGASELEPERRIATEAVELMAPEPDLDEIGAAARLALRLVAGE